MIDVVFSFRWKISSWKWQQFCVGMHESVIAYYSQFVLRVKWIQSITIRQQTMFTSFWTFIKTNENERSGCKKTLGPMLMDKSYVWWIPFEDGLFSFGILLFIRLVFIYKQYMPLLHISIHFDWILCWWWLIERLHSQRIREQSSQNYDISFFDDKISSH